MARAAGWIGIAAAGAAMLLLTWGSWPHVIVDFGRELYVPWRLADPGANAGLFRDIAWFNGPLSPYWNALVFRVFGASLRALVLVNLVLVGATTVLLTSLVARIADAAAAVTTAAVFVTVFAFTRFDPIGNDSYLAPYSHEMTHGLLLSLVALLVFAGRRRSGRQAAIGSGLALGLVVLTKAELSLALGAALILGWALEARAPSRRPAAALFLISVLVPMTAATGLLALAMPLREAATAALGSWPSLLLTDVASLHFYRATLGTLGLGANLSAAAGWAA